MNIYDFNIHMPFDVSADVEHITANETVMDDASLVAAFKHYQPTFAPLKGMNFMLFNQELFHLDQNSAFIQQAKLVYPDAVFTALIDFRQSNPFEYIDRAHACGVTGIKFHSYIQKISDTDFSDCLKVAQYAESLGMFICIDASYGTTRMYKYDNLKLVGHLADFVSKVPIIILHSGSIRCFEAMLIAVEKQNVYLETSFSLPFYQGSSIEQDLAFVYRKVGCHRILYASDAPYVGVTESLECIQTFFEKHRFSTSEIENICYNNALKMIHHE